MDHMSNARVMVNSSLRWHHQRLSTVASHMTMYPGIIYIYIYMHCINVTGFDLIHTSKFFVTFKRHNFLFK